MVVPLMGSNLSCRWADAAWLLEPNVCHLLTMKHMGQLPNVFHAQKVANNLTQPTAQHETARAVQQQMLRLNCISHIGLTA